MNAIMMVVVAALVVLVVVMVVMMVVVVGSQGCGSVAVLHLLLASSLCTWLGLVRW
jgi:hypothetical protein